MGNSTKKSASTSKALVAAVEQVINAADALRDASKRSKDPAVLSAAIAIAGIAVTLREGKADADELRALAVLVASWGAR